MKEKLLSDMIGPLVEDLGYSLWGLQMLPQKGQSLLRVFIDHADGIDVNDCARCSHEISGLLDVEDPIKTAYVLEVSSPGLDRLLFSAAHFQRYIGHQATVKLMVPVNGARKVKGVIDRVEGEHITLQSDQDTFTFDFNNVNQARLVPDFDGVSR